MSKLYDFLKNRYSMLWHSTATFWRDFLFKFGAWDIKKQSKNDSIIETLLMILSVFAHCVEMGSHNQSFDL